MTKLKCTRPDRLGKKLSLPYIGNTVIPADGIIEVDEKLAAMLVQGDPTSWTTDIESVGEADKIAKQMAEDQKKKADAEIKAREDAAQAEQKEKELKAKAKADAEAAVANKSVGIASEAPTGNQSVKSDEELAKEKEIAEMTASINSKTYPQLKQLAKEAGIPNAEYKSLKAEELKKLLITKLAQ